jgi:ABC-type amino acid transport system permease subunit
MQTGLPGMTYVLATLVLWALSGAIAVVAGFLLAALSLDPRLPTRAGAEAVITLARGVPTSLVVVAAGILTSRLPTAAWLPDVFPGTPPGLQTLAWAVTLAVALGTAGNLAVIFRTAYLALGRHRIEQARTLGLPPLRRVLLLGHEAALMALPPTSARLVHHLHNTAFAALFPVADLFGWVQDRANTTFEVTTYVLIGAGVYVFLSGCIWLGGRALEFRIASAPSKSRGVQRAAA